MYGNLYRLFSFSYNLVGFTVDRTRAIDNFLKDGDFPQSESFAWMVNYEALTQALQVGCLCINFKIWGHRHFLSNRPLGELISSITFLHFHKNIKIWFSKKNDNHSVHQLKLFFHDLSVGSPSLRQVKFTWWRPGEPSRNVVEKQLQLVYWVIVVFELLL